MGFPAALLLCCSTGMGYEVCAVFVFVAATFTVALFFIIRRLSDLRLHYSRFTLSRFFSRFTPSRLHEKSNLPYPSLRKRDFKLRKCLIYEFPTALLLRCSTALCEFFYNSQAFRPAATFALHNIWKVCFVGYRLHAMRSARKTGTDHGERYIKGTMKF